MWKEISQKFAGEKKRHFCVLWCVRKVTLSCCAVPAALMPESGGVNRRKSSWEKSRPFLLNFRLAINEFMNRDVAMLLIKKQVDETG